MNETRKTEKMQLLEYRRGETIESLLRNYYAEGLTDEEIADRLDISRQSFYKWLKLLGASVSGRIVQFEGERETVAL